VAFPGSLKYASINSTATPSLQAIAATLQHDHGDHCEFKSCDLNILSIGFRNRSMRQLY
jgi:hypothetical protein